MRTHPVPTIYSEHPRLCLYQRSCLLADEPAVFIVTVFNRLNMKFAYDTETAITHRVVVEWHLNVLNED